MRNPEKFNHFDLNEEKAEEVDRKIPGHIQFRRKEKGWTIISRSNFDSLIYLMKKGEVDAINATTLTDKEAEMIGDEGFSLFPEKKDGVHDDEIEVLKVEKKNSQD